MALVIVVDTEAAWRPVDTAGLGLPAEVQAAALPRPSQSVLAAARARPGGVLAGMHASTDQPRCDVEHRLFTNLGQRASRRAWPVLGSSGGVSMPARAGPGRPR